LIKPMIRKLSQALAHLLKKWKAINRTRLLVGLGFTLLIISNLLFLLRQTKLEDAISAMQNELSQSQDRYISELANNRNHQLINNLLQTAQEEIQRSAKQQLSQETIARIAALSQKIAATQDSSRLSEARGHLLTELALMKMDTTSFQFICERVSFAGAVLENVQLDGKKLRHIDLRNASLRDASLIGTDLSGADLRGSSFWGANLREAKLDAANLKRVDFSWAKLPQASLAYALLDGAKFSNANFQAANFYAATIEWADLSNASFAQANMQCVGFKGSDLRQSNLQATILDQAYLGRTDMSEANLIDASLKEANMTGYSPINLIHVSVGDSLWLQKLSLWQVKGGEVEAQKYQVIANPSQPGSYYLELRQQP
ncbi:MAG: pentapeptide repeat-containing protein, partial [Bacteroidota bacterium]